MLLAFQFLYGSCFSSLKLDDTCRLVKKFPALLGLTAQDLVDLALSDDGIAFLADAGIVKQFIHVFQTAGTVVDHIFAFPGTVKPPCHGHFLKINGKLTVSVIQCDRHIGIAQRLPHLRTGKNNVLHGRAPKLFYLLFPQHPAHRIRHVAFAGAVRPHNAGNAVVEFKGNFIGKGLKALYFYTF